MASTVAPRRNHVGTASLLVAVAGTVTCHVARRSGVLPDGPWLVILTAGFEAALVGGLADWFAVTALFRHPLGIPIPHTAIIPMRRGRIIDSIVTMVEQEWLSPDVIGARLARFAPSTLVRDWLGDPEHVERLGGPLRDLLRAAARMLDDPELAGFVDRALRHQVREVPIDASAGRWLARAVGSDSAGVAFAALATSLANLAARPQTTVELAWWLDRSARKLRAVGKRLVPFMLRRKVVQRKLVEAACDYAAAELRDAAEHPEHPLRRRILDAFGTFAGRLAAGDAEALRQAERLRQAFLESLEAAPLVRDTLTRLRTQLEGELADPTSALARLVDRQLRTGILQLLDDPARCAQIDQWVRNTADDLLRRHHHQIGLTVRENLERLDPAALVAQIEDRVGADLQFIRLNGAVVGGLVGCVIAVVHWLTG